MQFTRTICRKRTLTIRDRIVSEGKRGGESYKKEKEDDCAFLENKWSSPKGTRPHREAGTGQGAHRTTEHLPKGQSLTKSSHRRESP